MTGNSITSHKVEKAKKKNGEYKKDMWKCEKQPQDVWVDGRTTAHAKHLLIFILMLQALSFGLV